MRFGWKPASRNASEHTINVVGTIRFNRHAQSHGIRVMAGRLELVVIQRDNVRTLLGQQWRPSPAVLVSGSST